MYITYSWQGIPFGKGFCNRMLDTFALAFPKTIIKLKGAANSFPVFAEPYLSATQGL